MGHYKHYKYGCKGQVGGLYSVLSVAFRHVYDGSYYALYIPIKTTGPHADATWAKSVSQWNDNVKHPETGETMKRFTWTHA